MTDEDDPEAEDDSGTDEVATGTFDPEDARMTIDFSAAAEGDDEDEGDDDGIEVDTVDLRDNATGS